jgi:hypothetical protein
MKGIWKLKQIDNCDGDLPLVPSANCWTYGLSSSQRIDAAPETLVDKPDSDGAASVLSLSGMQRTCQPPKDAIPCSDTNQIEMPTSEPHPQNKDHTRDWRMPTISLKISDVSKVRGGHPEDAQMHKTNLNVAYFQ